MTFGLPDDGRDLWAIGLISGTSADGVDAALVRFGGGQLERAEVTAFECRPYPSALRKMVFRAFQNELRTSELALLDAWLGEVFADAAEDLLVDLPVGESLHLVGSHGQTVWHQPDPEIPEGSDGHPVRATLQLGRAADLALRLRVPVVSNFRQQDLVAGGQGAPLATVVDWFLLRDPTEARAVQNIGGIGNVTYLPPRGAESEANAREAVVSFDTGPGNAWMDAAAVLESGGELSCDQDGLLAGSARPDQETVARLLSDPYFQLPPPKSTGRERFTLDRVTELRRGGLTGPALLSTLTEVTARSMAEAYNRWLPPIDRILVAGGGAHNPELLRRLHHHTGLPVDPTTRHGVPVDSREALAFALLAHLTLRHQPGNFPHTTGARNHCTLGSVTLA